MHCPYCDGYELRNQRLAILGNGDEGFELAMFLKHWSKDLVLLTHGKSTLSYSQLEFLTELHIPVIDEEIISLEHDKGQLTCIRMQNGLYCDAAAMYTKPLIEQHCNLPESLGCIFLESGHVQIDHHHQTSVNGVYAAGDCTSALRSVAQAVAAGNKAGMMIYKALTADKLSEASRKAEAEHGKSK
jgi:thioredoxin reductase